LYVLSIVLLFNFSWKIGNSVVAWRRENLAPKGGPSGEMEVVAAQLNYKLMLECMLPSTGFVTDVF